MSHHCQNASVPQHIYGQVRSEILYGLDQEKVGEAEECVIFGVTSIPSRALHFSILCESGAQWARIPIHMLRWGKPSVDKVHPIENLQCWDAHGWCFSVTQYEYLREMGCKYRTPSGEMIDACYWFTLDHTDNGFSLYPPEHKCYHLLMLEDGTKQIAAMPNNRIIWKDFSFVKPREKFDYKVMAPATWHAEEGRRNPQETAHTQEAEVTSGFKTGDVVRCIDPKGFSSLAFANYTVERVNGGDVFLKDAAIKGPWRASMFKKIADAKFTEQSMDSFKTGWDCPWEAPDLTKILERVANGEDVLAEATSAPPTPSPEPDKQKDNE